MTTMVEKVAKAIEDELSGEEFLSFEDAARSAIKAMRDADKTMGPAGMEAAVDSIFRQNLFELELGQVLALAVLGAWEAMIDAALSGAGSTPSSSGIGGGE